MDLVIHQFLCLKDNYDYVVQDEATGMAAAIDAPDAARVLEELDQLGWSLDTIINTHWHPDHTGGNQQVRDLTGARIVGPAEVQRLSAVDRIVRSGETVQLGRTQVLAIDTSGHTLGHLAFYDAAGSHAFTGDALFALGCGRMFEGTAEDMWAGLQRLAALPPDTLIHCGHDYTEANARFALSVDSSDALKRPAERIREQRAAGEPTGPTSLALGLETNPFLRAPELLPHLARATAFAALRKAQDDWRG